MSDAELNPNDGEDYTSRLYAWIAHEPAGVEGIIVFPVRSGAFLPLVTTDRAQALRMSPQAQLAADQRRTVARLVQFERGITLQVLPPFTPRATAPKLP